MQWYYLIVGYFCLLLAIGLFSYRLLLVSTGNKLSGVVSKIIVKKSTLTGTVKSKHINISYKNSSGQNCEFVADNSLLIYCHKIGEPVNLVEKDGRVIVYSLLNILAAPAFIFLMGVAVLVFVA